MELSTWQQRALNVFGLDPVYLSLETTAERLVLSAARGFILDRPEAAQLRALGLVVQTGESLDPRYFSILITRKS